MASQSPYELEPEEPPKYLYKIIPATAEPPDPLPVELPLSELDATDGFIHLSTAAQAPATARLYFGQEEVLYLARIEYTKVRKDVRWEVVGSLGCAHLYNGPQLGSGEIESVRKFERKAGSGGVEENWEQVFEEHTRDGWLSY